MDDINTEKVDGGTNTGAAVALEDKPELMDAAEIVPVLPVVHKKCPVCGNEKRLGAMCIDKLKRDGYLPEDYPFEGMTLQAPLVDTRPSSHHLVGVQVPIKLMNLTLDVCSNPECGAIYCTNFNILETVGQFNQQPAAGAPTVGLPQPSRAERRDVPEVMAFLINLQGKALQGKLVIKDKGMVMVKAACDA